MIDIYQIEEGDSLNSVAERFNTSIEQILSQNNISYPEEIEIGTRLVIPQEKESYFNTYTIEKGDTLYKIAREYNLNPELLAAFNGLNLDDYIYPNQEIMIPKKGYSYYLTAEGDTLNGVIDIFQSNKEKLLSENSTIYLLPGQLIVNKKQIWWKSYFFMIKYIKNRGSYYDIKKTICFFNKKL